MSQKTPEHAVHDLRDTSQSIDDAIARVHGRVLIVGSSAEMPARLVRRESVTAVVVITSHAAEAEALKARGLANVDIAAGTLTAPLSGTFDTVVLDGVLEAMDDVEEACLRRRLEHLLADGARVVALTRTAEMSEDRRSWRGDRASLSWFEAAYGPVALYREELGLRCIVARWRLPRRRGAPRVSVLLPTWNHADMLPKAIATVLAQKFTDFELVVVDDGSTDHTAAVLRQLEDPRCRVVHAPHGGLPRALNIATSLAHGEFITWTSSDNLCRERWLERLVGALDARSQAVFAHTGFQFIDGNGKALGNHVLDQPGIAALVCQSPGVASFLYRASLVGEVGFYDPDVSGAEDWDYWTRLALGRDVVYVPEVLYYYRLHANSLTARETPRIRDAARRVLCRSLARLGGPTRLERAYLSLAECDDADAATTDALWDMGLRVLRSPWADPGAARPYLELAASRRSGPFVQVALVALDGCQERWSEARARYEDLAAAGDVPNGAAIADCLERQDISALRLAAPGPDGQSSELIARERRRYLCPPAPPARGPAS